MCGEMHGDYEALQQQRWLTFMTGIKVHIWMSVHSICQTLLEVSDDPLLGLLSPPPFFTSETISLEKHFSLHFSKGTVMDCSPAYPCTWLSSRKGGPCLIYRALN